MDLSVGEEIVYDAPLKRHKEYIDPHNQASVDCSFDDWPALEQTEVKVLERHQRALFSVQEYIEMPEEYFGLVCLRSTWARLGLLAPPTIIDPGFRGYLTMEMWNSNERGIMIRTGDKVWTLVMLPAANLPPYNGRYQGQKEGVTLPKAFLMGR